RDPDDTRRDTLADTRGVAGGVRSSGAGIRRAGGHSRHPGKRRCHALHIAHDLGFFTWNAYLDAHGGTRHDGDLRLCWDCVGAACQAGSDAAERIRVRETARSCASGETFFTPPGRSFHQGTARSNQNRAECPKGHREPWPLAPNTGPSRGHPPPRRPPSWTPAFGLTCSAYTTGWRPACS